MSSYSAESPAAVPLRLLIFGLLAVSLRKKHVGPFATAQLIEQERVDEYHRRDYAWPPRESDYVPNTPGWRRAWKRRFRQIEEMEDPGLANKWNGFMSAVHSALLSPNFTENGWGLTRAPTYVVDELKRRLVEGLNDESTPEEEPGHGVTGEMPLFIDTMAYNARAMEELRALHEAWAGVPLVGSSAYGLRVYRNASNLDMHVDQAHTHIISSILHVDHDPESEPWPIVIEDLHGELNEVVLESGDMLLYESSKCMHGRPSKFSGSWYSSLFTHYMPSNWDGDKIWMDAQYRIPPTWMHQTRHENGEDELAVVETSFHEPGCKNNWCALKDSLKWRGPAEGVGKVLSRGNATTTLQLPEEWLNEL
uniref:Uncharacterized protein n=1 Tax=Odontella aurita TaxID=265563 RepID=A0A7S4IRW5_9STRA|mmetsp:Transcript_29359/g.86995  ORF Transcript_29359/g.86995 Transcript_29359/m.86995 type:complete len:365 (+) Transcript_29359:182-1276(+)